MSHALPWSWAEGSTGSPRQPGLQTVEEKAQPRGWAQQNACDQSFVSVGVFETKKLQYLFGGWPSKFIGKGRIFTVALCKHVCMELRNNFELDGVVPKEEAVRLRSLLQVARKRKLQQPKAMSMNPMDTMDTLPMEDCCHSSHFLNVSNPCNNITLHDPWFASLQDSWIDGAAALDHQCLASIWRTSSFKSAANTTYYMKYNPKIWV